MRVWGASHLLAPEKLSSERYFDFAELSKHDGVLGNKHMCAVGFTSSSSNSALRFPGHLNGYEIERW